MPTRSGRSRPSSLPRGELGGPLLAGAAALVAAWAFVSFLPVFRYWLIGDVAFYENWGGWLASHRVPYRDFALEYPPGALPVFDAPPYLRKLALAHGGYGFWFRALLLVLGLLALVGTAWILARLGASRRRAYAALVLAGVAPALLGPVALARYDYWPALLAVAGVAALVAGRATLACGLFAAGAVAKVYPIILLPLALIELGRRGGARAVAGGVVAAGAVLAAGFAPFAVLAPHGLWWSLSSQASRPLQVESLGSALLVAAHELGGLHLEAVKSYGSDNFVGRVPDAVSSVSGIVSVLAVLLVYVLYARGRPTAQRLVTACTAAIVAYVAFAKVFSPQYLVWLVPLVPLVGGRRGLRANVLFAVVLAMTQIWEPYRYGQYEATLTPWLSWLVIVRDLLVVALLWVLVAPEPGSERHAEQLDPARAPAV